MSIAVVAMTQNRYKTLENGTQENLGPEFYWDNKVQGYVLSSFFYGYITTQLLGGYFSTRLGGKIIFGAGIATTAILTLVTPWLAEVSVYSLITARIIMGIFEGMTFSSVYTVWSKWIPPLERSRVTGIANSGSYTGTVFAMTFYAYISSLLGWKSIFWFSGTLGLIWSLIWAIIQAESPENDPKISESELHYIQLSLAYPKAEIKPSVPWKSIFLSKAVWALNVVLFCESWGFYTMLTLLPKYFKDIYEFDLSKSGILSALPYVGLAIAMQLTGQVADRILIGKKFTINQVRKTFVAIGFLAQTVFLMGAAFNASTVGTVFCLVAAVSFGAFAISVVGVNGLDIAPKFASILIGMNNTFGTIPGIISPIIAGHIISTDNPTVAQWRIVFYITASLYLLGALFYMIFASGNLQSWAVSSENKSEKEENNGSK